MEAVGTRRDEHVRNLSSALDYSGALAIELIVEKSTTSQIASPLFHDGHVQTEVDG